MFIFALLAGSLCLGEIKEGIEICMSKCEHEEIKEPFLYEVNDINIEYIRESYRACINNCLEMISRTL